MKNIEITLKYNISETDFMNAQFQEMINSIKSGQFQKDMQNDETTTIKMNDVKMTIKVT